MTDLLLKPDNTGDIPTAVGEKTVRLTGMAGRPARTRTVAIVAASVVVR